jgi:ABC-type sugar transport system permease subunit
MMTTNVTTDSSGAPRRRAGWAAWLLLVPLMLWLFVFVIAPSGIMLFYSFCQRGELGEIKVAFTTQDINGNGRIDGNEANQPPRSTTFDNYRRVFDPGFNPRRPYDSRGVPMYLVIIGKALLYGAIIGAMSAVASWLLRVDDPMAMPRRRQLIRWLGAVVLVVIMLILNSRIESLINHLGWSEWTRLPLRAMKPRSSLRSHPSGRFTPG